MERVSAIALGLINLYTVFIARTLHNRNTQNCCFLPVPAKTKLTLLRCTRICHIIYCFSSVAFDTVFKTLKAEVRVINNDQTNCQITLNRLFKLHIHVQLNVTTIITYACSTSCHCYTQQHIVSFC